MPRPKKYADRREYSRAYYLANKGRQREASRRWKDAHPERVKQLRHEAYLRNKANGKAREWHLRARYGFTPDEEQVLFKRQRGRCAICATKLEPPGPGVLRTHLDHSAKTGQVRGFLCIRCNHGLGNFSDSPEVLQKALDYLAQF